MESDPDSNTTEPQHIWIWPLYVLIVAGFFGIATLWTAGRIIYAVEQGYDPPTLAQAFMGKLDTKDQTP